MRTTLTIDDRLLAEAKKRAADRHSSVSQVINEALARAFSPSGQPKSNRDFQMLTYGPAKAKSIQSKPEDFQELEVAEDLKPYGP